MLSVAEALDAILAEVRALPPGDVELADSLGLVLAEEIISDADSPPFDKALMDGFAVRSDDLPDGRGTLTLLEEVTAGRLPTLAVNRGGATQIMTGAPVPRGADAVVRVEDTQVAADRGGARQVRIATAPVSPGMNILRRGTSMKRGDRILPAGRMLRPQELGALAELGRHRVAVHRRPKIAVLATGDELVPVEQLPGPGQIRNSNETMLAAQIRRAGGEPLPLGIARDESGHLRERIAAGLLCDVLLLSGGVSAGKLDLVPSELESAGVRKVFHKVQMKPGKPLWFGVLESRESRVESPEPEKDLQQSSALDSGVSTLDCLVFGLPGNPVSSMVCFELFVRTAVRRLMGIEPALLQPIAARLTKPHQAKGDRPTYFPSHIAWTTTGAVVTPVDWRGSSDLRGTVEANGMALFPPGDRTYDEGESIGVIAWDS